MTDQKHIRNFSIIAHIDHGKSTLADRLLEETKTISAREMRQQTLDDMDLERERGITIKAHAVRMDYRARDGGLYQFNLIDTPGHVDFTYEVSRSLSACEGALLVVDAAQGIEAQTVSNLYLALENDLEIIPVLNKVDLPSARPDEVAEEIADLIGGSPEDVIRCSAKTGLGIHELMETIVRRVPAPSGNPDAPLRALIFDSMYDTYQGAAAYIRVVDGELKTGDKIKFFAHKKTFDVDEVGVKKIKNVKVERLRAGEVGYIYASIKEVADTKVGDTITTVERPASKPLPGFIPVKPMVFSGLYPATTEEYTELRDALEKLKLNDSALTFQPESSVALGFGFRCGFLGLLHMEIVTERLQREYDQTIINTVPNVEYFVYTKKGEKVVVDSPAQLPAAGDIDYIQEPFVEASIITPTEFLGGLMKLTTERRGRFKNTEYLTPERANMTCVFPLGEVIFDFYDKLKSISRGYASFDYGFPFYEASKIVKLDILLNGDPVDALSVMIHKDKAYHYGNALAEKLRSLIPRQLYEVAIQAAIGSKVIARSTVKALRKQVTAKCYGGDITRKRKLLEKQKEGKKRMKMVGTVEVPQQAFLAALQIER
ncbi:MAG TPA: translation elongation factor 4 [candidate division Zixibacteria bacterium]|nr:translation elongation factor 4 [candidate division Zixibacteria bacterium]